METCAFILITMSQSVKSTNKTNLEIADRTNRANLDISQMSNDYNMAMLDKQIQEQWAMWNAQNEYNSPAAQRQRREDAGYNPFMDGDGGTASSMTAPSAQPAVTPTMVGATMQADPPLQKMLGVLQGVQSMVDTVQSAIEKNQQIQKGAIDTRVAKQTELAQVKLLNANADIADIGARFEGMFKRMDLVSKGYQNEILFQQSRSAAYQVAMDAVNAGYLPIEKAMGVQTGMQSLRLMYQQGEINDKQLNKMSYDIAKAIADARIAESDADVADQTVDARVREANANATNAENNQGSSNEIQLIQRFIEKFAKGDNPYSANTPWSQMLDELGVDRPNSDPNSNGPIYDATKRW